MPYYITNSDTTVSITVPDGVIDTSSYSLSLVGRNVSNYGQYFAENSLRHLENFASVVAPSAQNLLIGQLWYDKEKQIIRVWDGATWKAQTGITVENQIPGSDVLGTDAPPQPGTALFNREDLKLYVYDDAQDTRPWAASYAGEVSSRYSDMLAMGQPTQYGSRVRNIYLIDSNNVYRAVTAIIYNSNSTGFNEGDTDTRFGKETIIAIFSDHEPFQPKDALSHTEGEEVNYYSELFVDVQGIARRQDGFILPGLNLRDYDNQAAVPLAEKALLSDSALRIRYVGPGSSYSNDLEGFSEAEDNAPGDIITIEGEDFHTTSRDVMPGEAFDQALTIGDDDQRYASINVLNVNTDVIQAGSDHTGNANVNASGEIIGQWTLAAGSTLQATYADLAERYQADMDYEPGTVVCLGGEYEITASRKLADAQVFGVISTDPAYIMNAGLAGGLPVALAGRVPVNVVGPVRKGDRLISSELPGVAVALSETDAEYDPRTVVGRSLETNTERGLKQVEIVVGVK